MSPCTKVITIATLLCPLFAAGFAVETGPTLSPKCDNETCPTEMSSSLPLDVSSLLQTSSITLKGRSQRRWESPTKPENIYSPTSTELWWDVYQGMLARPTIEANDAPWMRIPAVGGTALYVSLTITGDKTLQSILGYANTKSPEDGKDWIVFSGRHGGIPNVRGDHTTWDASHLATDTTAVKQAEGQLGVTVAVLDCATHQADQVDWLKTETAKYLREGKNVLWAWCFGLGSLNEQERPKSKEEHARIQEATLKTPLKDLYDTFYADWVPTEVAGSAGSAGSASSASSVGP